MHSLGREIQDDFRKYELQIADFKDRLAKNSALEERTLSELRFFEEQCIKHPKSARAAEDLRHAKKNVETARGLVEFTRSKLLDYEQRLAKHKSEFSSSLSSSRETSHDYSASSDEERGFYHSLGR